MGIVEILCCHEILAVSKGQPVQAITPLSITPQHRYPKIKTTLILGKQQQAMTQGASIPLVSKVVSTNWRDGYLLKAADYEETGVPEYWIVDYLGLGSRRFIGNLKQLTISVYSLLENKY